MHTPTPETFAKIDLAVPLWIHEALWSAEDEDDIAQLLRAAFWAGYVAREADPDKKLHAELVKTCVSTA